MTSRERPVRSQPPNFEVFVDTCLRVAAENGISLPPELGDRDAWDQAYRELGEHVDRYPRGSVIPQTSPAVEESPDSAAADTKSPMARRRLLLVTPAALAVAAAAVFSPGWFRESASPETGDSADEGVYSPLGRLLSGPLAKDNPVWSVAVGTVKGAPIAVSGSADGTVRLWDLTGSRPVRLLGAHQTTVGTMAVGAVRDKILAVSGSEDGVVRRWDLTTAKPTGTILGDRIYNAVKTVAIGTVKGTTVAIAGSDDGAIRIWDLATGRSYGNGLTGPRKGAESIAISNIDSRAVVVSGHWDGTIWTWSL